MARLICSVPFLDVTLLCNTYSSYILPFSFQQKGSINLEISVLYSALNNTKLTRDNLCKYKDPVNIGLGTKVMLRQFGNLPKKQHNHYRHHTKKEERLTQSQKISSISKTFYSKIQWGSKQSNIRGAR